VQQSTAPLPTGKAKGTVPSVPGAANPGPRAVLDPLFALLFWPAVEPVLIPSGDPFWRAHL